MGFLNTAERGGSAPSINKREGDTAAQGGKSLLTSAWHCVPLALFWVVNLALEWGLLIREVPGSPQPRPWDCATRVTRSACDLMCIYRALYLILTSFWKRCDRYLILCFTGKETSNKCMAHPCLEHKLSDSQSDAHSTKIMLESLNNSDDNSNDGWHLLSTHDVTGTEVGISMHIIPFIRSRHCHYRHFMGEETKAQKG